MDLPVRAPKVSCHACGNIRKSRIYCVRCATTFCQKCAMRILMEMGPRTYDASCPVCDLTCCCAQPRERGPCTRLYHCYKRCRAMRELGRTGASANPLAEASLRSKHFDPSKEHKLDSVTAQRIVNRILYAQSQEAGGAPPPAVHGGEAAARPQPPQPGLIQIPPSHLSLPPPPFPTSEPHPHQAFMDAMAAHHISSTMTAAGYQGGGTYEGGPGGTPYGHMAYMHAMAQHPQQYMAQPTYAPQDMYMSSSSSAWDVPISMLTPSGAHGSSSNMRTSQGMMAYGDSYASMASHTQATLAAAAAHSARLHSAMSMPGAAGSTSGGPPPQHQPVRAYTERYATARTPPASLLYPPVSLPMTQLLQPPVASMSAAAMEDSMRAMSAARAVRQSAASYDHGGMPAAAPARPSHGSTGSISSNSDGAPAVHVSRSPHWLPMYAPPLDNTMKAMSPFGLHSATAPGATPKLAPTSSRNFVVVPPPLPMSAPAHAGVRRGRSEMESDISAPSKRAHMTIVEVPKPRSRRGGASSHVDDAGGDAECAPTHQRLGLPQESQSALDLALELHEQGVSSSNMSSALAALSALRNVEEGAIQDTPAGADHGTSGDSAWQWAAATAVGEGEEAAV